MPATYAKKNTPYARDSFIGERAKNFFREKCTFVLNVTFYVRTVVYVCSVETVRRYHTNQNSNIMETQFKQNIALVAVAALALAVAFSLASCGVISLY